MTSKLVDLRERIRNGEHYISTLKQNDPKRPAVLQKLASLKSQLRELEQGAGVSEGTPQPSDRTYDLENTVHARPSHKIDPRPDLKEDSGLWTALLELAAGYDEELCAVLNGFRCGGTRLRFGETRWVLRPDIDPSGYTGWTSQAEYDEAGAKYLQEWGSVLRAILDELTRRIPSQPAAQTEQVIQTVMQI